MTALPDATAPDALDAALTYAALGLRVVPIKAGGKHPPVPEWQRAATTDEATIRSWWTQLYRGCGVGIATGPASGVFVLDVDVSDGKSGAETLQYLIAQHGGLPDTPTARTGSGGCHYFFAWPAGVDIRNNQSGKLGAGLDIRGDGGQVVAAPSMHASGRRYEWIRSPSDCAIAAAPAWMLDLLTAEPDPPRTPSIAPTSPGPFDDRDDSIAAWYNARTTWAELLSADGWTLALQRGGEDRWVRPGKSARDGCSATVGHAGRDVLKVFTSSVPELAADGAYSRFGYTAAMRHGGDRSAFARQLRTQRNADEGVERRHEDLSWAVANDAGVVALPDGIEPAADDTAVDYAFAHLVNWREFWEKDRAEHEWLVYPLVPLGRAVALYAPAKAGKSSVILAAVANAVSGKAAFGGEKPSRPVSVLYLDYEMTEEDLEERLTELGFGPDDDLSGLHYALLPSLEPLDTPAGAKAVVNLAATLQVDLVVVDTFGRAVEGEENSADTVRAFYRNTGLALKALGIAVLRTDHTGKDPGKGQRGTSAKTDDVDVVWSLTRTETGVRIKRTHSRISWVPDVLEITRAEEEHEGTVAWSMTQQHGYAAGTKEMAEIFDRLDLPVSVTKRAARAALKGAGERCSNELLNSVLRWRRRQAEEAISDVFDVRPTLRPTFSGAAETAQRPTTAQTENGRSEHAAHVAARSGPLGPRVQVGAPDVVRPTGPVDPPPPNEVPPSTPRSLI